MSDVEVPDPPDGFSWFSILGVSEDATFEEIKDAYRSKVAVMHPDRGGDPVEFSYVSKAWSILKNTEMRNWHRIQVRIKGRSSINQLSRDFSASKINKPKPAQEATYTRPAPSTAPSKPSPAPSPKPMSSDSPTASKPATSRSRGQHKPAGSIFSNLQVSITMLTGSWRGAILAVLAPLLTAAVLGSVVSSILGSSFQGSYWVVMLVVLAGCTGLLAVQYKKYLSSGPVMVVLTSFVVFMFFASWGFLSGFYPLLLVPILVVFGLWGLLVLRQVKI